MEQPSVPTFWPTTRACVRFNLAGIVRCRITSSPGQPLCHQVHISFQIARCMPNLNHTADAASSRPVSSVASIRPSPPAPHHDCAKRNFMPWLPRHNRYISARSRQMPDPTHNPNCPDKTALKRHTPSDRHNTPMANGECCPSPP